MKIAEIIPQYFKKSRKKFRVFEKICIFATKLNTLWKAYTNYSTRN